MTAWDAQLFTGNRNESLEEEKLRESESERERVREREREIERERERERERAERILPELRIMRERSNTICLLAFQYTKFMLLTRCYDWFYLEDS